MPSAPSPRVRPRARPGAREGALRAREAAAYGASDLGASLTYVAVNTWLLYHLVEVVGLEPLVAGGVFVAGRALDALLDPVMGSLTDRLRDRVPRLAFVAGGALPLGIAFALLWRVPTGLPGPLAAALALLAFSLFSVAYTVVQVPTVALTPELAPGYDERTPLTSWRVGFGVLASLLAVAAPPLLADALGGGDAARGWRATGAVLGAVAAASWLVMAAGGRGALARRKAERAAHRTPPAPGPRPAPVPPAAPAAPAGPVRDALSAFRVPAFASAFRIFVTVTLGLMIVNSMLPFFLESVLRVEGGAASAVLGGLFAVAALSFPAWTALAGRRGKRAALALGLALLAAALLLLALLPLPTGVSAPLAALVAPAGAGLGAAMLFPWAMLPDAVEFDALASGRRREGLLYALATFGQKTAGSLGVFANAAVVTAFGYRPGAAEQSAATVRGIELAVGPVAAVVFALALLLVLRDPVTREAHEEARGALERREEGG